MRDNYLEEYYSFLRFPSVSTDDKYKEKLVECANWLVNKLTRIGLRTQLVPTKRHPIVWARNEHRPGRPTVLIYGHYDVQPPDPLDLWDSPPFEPVVSTIRYGLRGLSALEVKVTGPKMDLHSGVFGGAVANPITALAQLLATLHDREGRVAIAGFYDRVKPLEDWERDAWRKLPVDGDKLILEEKGMPELFGESGLNS